MALSDNGRFGAIAGKKSLPTIEVAPARHSEGSPARLPSTATRNLPPAPKLLTKAQPVPHLDAVCKFPWFGVAGCRGKDTAAMLRLTVSDDIEVRSRLSAVPVWYVNVRKSYGGK